MLFQAENYVCYIIYDARSLEANQVGRNMLRDTRHLGIQSSIQMICGYILQRQQLVNVFVLVDVRLEPQNIDIEFINWLGQSSIPFYSIK